MRPLVPADRKLAKRIERDKRNEEYARQQVALQTGDEANMPYRDRGRVKRYTRQFIDARWSLSEFALPAMILFLVGSLAISFFIAPRYPEVAAASSVVFVIILYVLFGVAILEAVVVWRRIKKRVTERYPDDPIPKRTWFYAFSRMIMVRRFRSPRPQNDRGDYPS